MHESFVRRLLYDLANRLGRNPKQMDPFVQKLESQWYDSKDALKSLTPNDYKRLEIPERLAIMIAEAVGATQQKQSVF